MKKFIVWVFNAVVALMSILAIICYFIGPVWEIDVKYSMSANQLNEMVGSNLSDYDVEFDEGIEVSLGLKIDMDVLMSTLGAASEATVQKIVDNNVDNIVKQLKGTINSVSKSVVKSVASKVIGDKVHEQVKELLKDGSEEEIEQKLNAAGIDDDYIATQTGNLIDSIFAENASVDKVTDQVIHTVEDVCDKLVKSGDPSFSNAKVSEENKDSIRSTVEDALSSFAESDGSISMEDYINNLIVDALRSMNGSRSNEGKVALLAAESNNDKLVNEVRAVIEDMIPDEIVSILSYALMGVLGLVLISALTWIYILIKLLVKLITFSKSEPTVKLKLPIILGWLPFLILTAVPTLVLTIAPDLLTKINSHLAGLSLSFASFGWLALLSACVCFVISIFYMVVRKASKKTKKEN